MYEFLTVSCETFLCLRRFALGDRRGYVRGVCPILIGFLTLLSCVMLGVCGVWDFAG